MILQNFSPTAVVIGALRVKFSIPLLLGPVFGNFCNAILISFIVLQQLRRGTDIRLLYFSCEDVRRLAKGHAICLHVFLQFNSVQWRKIGRS